jgi:2-oxoglutarate dehydrogenase E2 component (dihydrolipoamide succinyltransferase)
VAQQVGEKVKKDETLLEISTDKVDSEIPSPATGTLVEILVQEQKTVPVRTIIAYLDTDGGVSVEAPKGETPQPAPARSEPPKQETVPVPRKAEPLARLSLDDFIRHWY